MLVCIGKYGNYRKLGPTYPFAANPRFIAMIDIQMQYFTRMASGASLEFGPPSPPNRMHRPRRRNKLALINLMPRPLRPNVPTNGIGNGLIARPAAQQPLQIRLLNRKQAVPQLPIGS